MRLCGGVFIVILYRGVIREIEFFFFTKSETVSSKGSEFISTFSKWWQSIAASTHCSEEGKVILCWSAPLGCLGEISTTVSWGRGALKLSTRHFILYIVWKSPTTCLQPTSRLAQGLSSTHCCLCTPGVNQSLNWGVEIGINGNEPTFCHNWVR